MAEMAVVAVVATGGHGGSVAVELAETGVPTVAMVAEMAVQHHSAPRNSAVCPPCAY